MAVRAYVLIDAAIGSNATAIVTLLDEIPEIEHIDPITGPHDIVCIVNVPGLQELGALQSRIHDVAGVARTMTCVAVGG